MKKFFSKLGKGVASLFKNDGNNPLAAIGMVIAMGVIPLALMGGIVGGAAWLGYLGIKAVIGLATAGTAAGVFTPGVIAGTVLGGGALLAAGHYTGALQGLGYMFKDKVLRRENPDAPLFTRKVKAPEQPSQAWQNMVSDLNARKGFDAAAKKDDKAEATPAAKKQPPQVDAPKP